MASAIFLLPVLPETAVSCHMHAYACSSACNTYWSCKMSKYAVKMGTGNSVCLAITVQEITRIATVMTLKIVRYVHDCDGGLTDWSTSDASDRHCRLEPEAPRPGKLTPNTRSVNQSSKFAKIKIKYES